MAREAALLERPPSLAVRRTGLAAEAIEPTAWDRALRPAIRGDRPENAGQRQTLEHTSFGVALEPTAREQARLAARSVPSPIQLDGPPAVQAECSTGRQPNRTSV